MVNNEPKTKTIMKNVNKFLEKATSKGFATPNWKSEFWGSQISHFFLEKATLQLQKSILQL